MSARTVLEWLCREPTGLTDVIASAGLWPRSIIITGVNASGATAASRQFQVGRFSPTLNINLNVALSGQADLMFIAPTYTFVTPVLGGQFSA